MLFIIIFLNLFLRISSHDILKYTIEEKLPINTLISDLSKDLNIESNGFFELYELSPLNRNLFTIHNQTGHLTIKSILNREQMCLKRQCSCNSCEIILQLLIKIQDKIFYKIVEIKIKDLNDHSPIFDKQSMTHVINIKENVPLGYRIILPSANDPDEGMNSVQSYRLDGPNSEDFDVDFSSFDIPYLIVRSSLDRQHLSFYSLLLTASDHGEPPRSTSIQLDIRVLNINDSMPTFVQSIYSIDIREDTVIGTTILKIEAFNDNSDEKIFYELLTESPFIIDRLTGQIQLSKTLDYEREKSYRLIVKAYEKNSIPSYASIFLRIIDINDNPVSIQIKVEGDITLEQKQHDKSVLFIQEDLPLGTTIAHIILHDLDSFVNGNPYLQLRTNEPPSPLIYKLIYQNNFHNTKLYSLVLNQYLNREVKSIYNSIQLISHDSGTPTLHTKLHLILNITDVNDCIPKILTNSTEYNINENNPIGYVIDKLIAYDCDLDENAEIEYHLLNQTDLLILNSKTGELSLNQSIDFDKFNRNQQKNETTIDLEFYIKVQDHGKPSLSSQTKIIFHVHDLNDHSPEFSKTQSYNWTFSPSSLQPGSVLGRIHAYDNDSGLYGLINYSIRSFHPCLTLDITSLGYVYIPYDSSILTCSLLSYTFEITANDYDPVNSRSTTQLLTINIESKSIHNNYNHKILPKLLPVSTHRIKLDKNTRGKTAFIIDITTLNNYTYQPAVYLNNTNLLSCWNISSTGEISLISNPYASSYILSLNVIDHYTKNITLIKLQIDLCNGSILHSCQSDDYNNRKTLIYAAILALVITSIIIIIISLIICLCCGKNKRKNEILSSTHQHTFLQYNDDYHSEKTDISTNRRKSSSNSTIREDDHDSACIINAQSSSSSSSSSSKSSSSGIVTKQDIWYNQKESTMQMYPTSSTYYYDLKLAELLRQNQNPPCIHLNELPTIPQSSSTDYGFSSLELSASSSTSTIPNQHIEIDIDQSPKKQFNMKSFISSRECVV